MKAYTLTSAGVLEPGIALADGHLCFGADEKGNPYRVAVDPRATVRDGRLVESPGRGVLLLIRGEGAPSTPWRVRASKPEDFYRAMTAAKDVDELARVWAHYPDEPAQGWYPFHVWREGDATHTYGYVETGSVIEVVRGAGRIVQRVSVGNEATVTDPWEEARRA